MDLGCPSPSALAAAAFSCVLLVGCEGGGPSDPPDPLHLAVAVRVDSASFRSTGDFWLELVPADRSGTTYLADAWTISTSLIAPSTIVAATLDEGVEPSDSEPVAAAILIDDSGSMRSSDPERIRASAAQRFWRDILPGRPGNVVALLDFGRGGVTPTPGFERTNLLAGFTSDQNALDAALDQIQAVPGGATPLYQAGLEVVKWIDTTTPRTYQRTLVVITDGAPSDESVAQELYGAAASYGVRVFAVGLGAAAEDDPPGEEALRLLELASRTGGIYGAAEPPEELHAVLHSLSQSASPERLLVHLQLSPLPARGTMISGTVALSGFRGNVAAEWSFAAP